MLCSRLGVLLFDGGELGELDELRVGLEVTIVLQGRVSPVVFFEYHIFERVASLRVLEAHKPDLDAGIFLGQRFEFVVRRVKFLPGMVHVA